MATFIILYAMALPVLTLESICCSLTCENEDCDVSSQIENWLRTTNCSCNTYFVDMIDKNMSECKPRYKSKKRAFLLSYFFGWVGADFFYLANDEYEGTTDYYYNALFKLFTVGGGPIMYLSLIHI